MRLTTQLCLWSAAASAALTGTLWPVENDAAPAFRALWRKPGVDGLACMSCHTVSGREIWMSDVTPDDVRRRAKRHLGAEDADLLALLTSELRRDVPHLAGRPFAPPDSPLPGKTPAERDRAFAQRLVASGFPLLTKEIRNLADARRAAEDIRAVPLTDIPVGLPLDPLSRDPVRPESGPMLGDWIPDVSENSEDYSQLAQLSRLKRSALAFYEQTLASGKTPAPSGSEHPVWAVGAFARLNADATARSFGLTPEQAKTIGVRLESRLDLDVVALNWFWIGWTLDPSLATLSLDRQARNGSYMSELLWKAGPYPMHAVYFAARRPLESKRPGSALQPDFTAFVNDENLARYQPKDKEARREFVVACRNLLRMDCLLLSGDLRNGHASPNAVGAMQQLRALWAYVKGSDSLAENITTKRIVGDTLQALIIPARKQRAPTDLTLQ